MSHQVDILLSTYNGEVFLIEQLESIANQTYIDWNLLVRDDGSEDSTLDIIQSFSERFKGRVRIIQDDKGNLGSSLSFLELLDYAESEFIMFCDQDDIWANAKIETSLNKIKELQNENDNKKPLLIASDLTIVDKHNKEIIEHSFWNSRKDLDIIFSDPQNFVAQSVFSGNTMIFNKFCLEKIPRGSEYLPYFHHDQWVTIHVAYYGKVHFLKRCLIRYRQHDRNVIGPYKLTKNYLIRRFLFIYTFLKNISRLKRQSKVRVNVLYIVFFKLYYNVLKLIKG